MVKAIAASLVHDMETEKSQNHHSHSTNGERNDCDNTMIDVFRWSRCKKPLPQKVMRSFGIPLPIEHIEVLIRNFKTRLLFVTQIIRHSAISSYFVICILLNGILFCLNNRYWRRILTGKMCSGHKQVFGLLGKNIRSLGCISYQ